MKRILPAVFTATCLLSACLVNTYAKDTKAFKTAQPIICNKTYKTKVKGESQKYFKFTLTRSAKIAITFNGQVNVELSYLNSKGKAVSTMTITITILKKALTISKSTTISEAAILILSILRRPAIPWRK